MWASRPHPPAGTISISPLPTKPHPHGAATWEAATSLRSSWAWGIRPSKATNFTQDLFAAEASPYYAAFVQDTYHVRPNLTITAGLRWDIFGGKTERHNRLEYFDPTAVGTDPNTGLPFTGGEVFASSGHRSPFTTNLTNFAPRLGFSWQPAKHLVVRGGAGFYFGPSAQMVGIGHAEQRWILHEQ